MPVTIAGADFSEMELQEGSPTGKRLQNGFFELKFIFVSLASTAYAQLPQIGTDITTQWPGYEEPFFGHQVIDAEVQADESPAHRRMVVTFGPPNQVKFNNDPNFLRREMVTGNLEKPIQSHPNWLGVGPNNWNDATKEAILEDGITGYVVASPIYRLTTRPGNFQWNQSQVIKNVGKREAPTELADAVADQWLKMSRNITDDEKVIEMVEEWQYADTWNTGSYEIYEEVT